MSDKWVDIILIVSYAMLAVAILAMLFSAVSSVIKRSAAKVAAKGVPVAGITVAVAAILVVTLGASLFFSSADAVEVNGKEYADSIWLRLTDMFVYSSIALFVLAIIALCLSGIMRHGSGRKSRGK